MFVDGCRWHRRAVCSSLRRQVVEDLDLERLSALREERSAFRRRQFTPHERMVGLDALGHPHVDRREVVGSERARQLEVVVEAVGNCRPDPKPGAGEQVHDRLRHHVGGGMAHGVQIAVRTGIEQLVG